MEEVAFPLGWRNWMSFELAGMRRRAFQAEGAACAKALTKRAVHGLL